VDVGRGHARFVAASARIALLGAFSLQAGCSSDRTSPTNDDHARDAVKDDLCPCAEGASCKSGELGSYGASCDGGGWVGLGLRIGDANPASYSFSPLPCAHFEVTNGAPCLHVGQVCAYAPGGCDGARSWYACQLGPEGGEWQPAAGLCPALCPDVAPEDGTPCPAESTFCHFVSACGAIDEAVCRDGSWSVTINPCACADSDRFHTGAACSSPGVSCREGHGDILTSVCDQGEWASVTGSPSCPAKEAAADDSCHEGDACAWTNACGGVTQGRCIDGLWSKTASACAGSPLSSCSAGVPCEPRVSCSTQCAQTGQPSTACACGSNGTLECRDEICPCLTCFAR
jgi:hypothetical protein